MILPGLNNLCIYHKRNKKWYWIKSIEFSIGEIMREYYKNVPPGHPEDNIIESIVLWDREDSKLRRHKFVYTFKNGKRMHFTARMELLDLNSIKSVDIQDD